MENVYILFYGGMVISALIYAFRRDLKSDRRSIWLHKMGLYETFKYTRRY